MFWVQHVSFEVKFIKYSIDKTAEINFHAVHSMGIMRERLDFFGLGKLSPCGLNPMRRNSVLPGLNFNSNPIIHADIPIKPIDVFETDKKMYMWVFVHADDVIMYIF